MPWVSAFFDFLISANEPAAPRQRPEPVATVLESNWRQIRLSYFPGRVDLDSYLLKWSMRRQTMTLASCNVERRIIRVSSLMSFDDAAPYLEALLYHEMCHAALGPIKRKRGRRVVHGSDFKQLERRHPGIPALDHWIKSGGWTKLVRAAKRLESRK